MIEVTSEGWSVIAEDQYLSKWIKEQKSLEVEHPSLGHGLKYCEKFVTPGSCVIDVGAALGTWTIPLGRLVGPEGQVIAIEPNKEAVECLSANYEHSGNLAELIIHNKAATDFHTGWFKYYHSPSNPWENSLERECMGEVGEVEEVECITLDDLYIGQRPVSLIKIDAEGAELSVLRGARCLIQHHRPCVFLEVVPEKLKKFGDNLEDLFDFMDGWGYSYLLTPPEWVIDGNPPHDVLFIPKEKIWP